MALSVEQQREVLLELPKEQLVDIIIELTSKVEQLANRVEELENRLPRSAAPFGREEGEKVSKAKKSGRRKGHRGSYRQELEPTEVIEFPLEKCPECETQITDRKQIRQIIQEIPNLQLRVIELKTERGYCGKCQREVRSSHPEQVSLATGAAGTHLGRRAMATAIELINRYHLSKSKTAKMMRDFFGIRITRGGLVQMAHRVAKKLKPEYERLKQAIKDSKAINTDGTSWYVGKVGYGLHVFTKPDLTVYEITNSATREFVKDVVGKNYQGVLGSDCLSIYDEVNQSQQKCYAHHLRAIKKAEKELAPLKSGYLQEIRLLLETAMAIKKVFGTAELGKLERLESWSQQLLTKPRPTGSEEAVRRRLFKQRDHLFEFLKHKEVEATNNRAERQLRPAVIARKLSCGNRTEKGAETWKILSSLAVTCKDRGESFNELLKQKLTGSLSFG